MIIKTSLDDIVSQVQALKRPGKPVAVVTDWDNTLWKGISSFQALGKYDKANGTDYAIRGTEAAKRVLGKGGNFRSLIEAGVQATKGLSFRGYWDAYRTVFSEDKWIPETLEAIARLNPWFILATSGSWYHGIKTAASSELPVALKKHGFTSPQVQAFATVMEFSDVQQDGTTGNTLYVATPYLRRQAIAALKKGDTAALQKRATVPTRSGPFNLLDRAADISPKGYYVAAFGTEEDRAWLRQADAGFLIK